MSSVKTTLMRNQLPYRPTQSRPVALLPWRAERRLGRLEAGGLDGPHQGSQAGADREARSQRDRHRFARGADRDADAADQRADGASAHAPARPLLPPWAAEARREAPPLPQLPAEARSRGLSRPDQGARPAPLALQAT